MYTSWLAVLIHFPVRPTNGDTVLAFLLLGVNPRRPYDREYVAFTSMLNRQLATSLASTMLFEEEIRRSRDAAEAAALQQEQLTQQLAVQTSRLRRMTELSPLGMFLISPDGVLTEANDRWYEMTGHPRDETHEMSWMDQIDEGCKKEMEEGWHRLVVDHLPFTGELQLKGESTFNGESIEYWVLSNAQPEFASDGSLRSIMGSITDISHLKWAQGLQDRRLQEAEETRRQQNEFIDITSHEMRNPLSAILQCADDISSTLEEYRLKPSSPTQAIIEGAIEAANTISLCVQHQKSIVDDILTISKLDSNLLVITPAVVQPLSVAKRAVKMFDSELQAKDIKVVFEEHSSLEELEIDYITMDQSRVLQILINLMTNAIKFTAGMPKRMLTVSVGVSRGMPISLNTPDFEYIPTKTYNPNVTKGDDWGSGEDLFLRFKVQDTGCGLTVEEKLVLFKRFSQASPRTHAQYGGSGLGLFISRQLAELHGGQIGVASEAGVGSTFGFFIAARRADPPARNNVPQLLAAENDALNHAVTPQRQDVAASGPAASLVATKATPKIDPKELDILVVEDNLGESEVHGDGWYTLFSNPKRTCFHARSPSSMERAQRSIFLSMRWKILQTSSLMRLRVCRISNDKIIRLLRHSMPLSLVVPVRPYTFISNRHESGGFLHIS
jgi:PAS domain S-box-containing protein